MIQITLRLTEKEAKQILESDSTVYPPEGLIEKIGCSIKEQVTLDEMSTILNTEC